MDAKPTVGIIGIGEMGWPMAQNLKNAGYPICVFDVSQSMLEKAMNNGMTVCDSNKEVALKVENTIFISVRSDKQLREVLFGPNGIVDSERRDLIIINTCTIRPLVAREVAEEAGNLGIKLINAPVSGAKHGAEAGTLSIMVAGDQEAISECMPLLQVIGKSIHNLGPVGEKSQAAKLANNLMSIGNMLVGLEGYRFAKTFGITESELTQIVASSSGNSWVVNNWKWVTDLWDEYTPGSTLDIAFKDLVLVVEESLGSRINVPMTSLVSQTILRGRDPDKT